jgi:hypothetical protein
LLLFWNDTFIFLGRNLSARLPRSTFTKYHGANKIHIRGGKLCKKVLGYDANALYLCAISEVLPTGDYEQINEYDLMLLVF